MIPFATVEDYVRRYGPVEDIDALYECLVDATDLICSEMDEGGVDYVGQSESFSSRLNRVCRQVAHRAMGEKDDSDIPFGARQFSETASAFTASVSLANPYGDLFLTEAERRSLGIGNGRAVVFSPYG